MAKLPTITSILSGFGSTNRLNLNFSSVQAAFNNTLSLDGSSPNALGAVIDMNSHKIINLATPTGGSDAATKAYVDANMSTGGGSSGGDMFKSDNLAGLTSYPTARSNLGLGVFSTLADLSSVLTAGTNITLSTLAGVTTINSSSGGGDMLKTQNLSGLSNYTTARSNLGLTALAVASDVSSYLAAGTNVTLSTAGNVTTINASLAGGTVSSVAGSSTNGELVLFNGTSGASLKNSSCVPTANGLSLVSAANYAAMLTLLGVTTAGTTAIGTSGATIPLLSTANTWTLAQTFTVAPVFTNQATTRTALGLGTAAVAATTDFEPAGAYSAQNAQTGSSYTLALGDKGKLVTMSNASANTLTIPLNASVAFPVLTRIDIAALGVGQTSIVATGGVTIQSSGSKLKLSGQYSGASLVKTATDTWLLIGDITT